jgi:hypothetical protein
MYLVGGYKLTEEQVRQWCTEKHLEDPEWGQISFIVNSYLREQDLRYRILACDCEEETIFLLVTMSREDPNATEERYGSFKESGPARRVKEQIGIPDVQFITVANPYDDDDEDDEDDEGAGYELKDDEDDE